MSNSTIRARPAIAVAHPNIAFAKYWGKRPYGVNLPSVPSLSVTLAGLETRTEIGPAVDERERLWLDGEEAEGRPVKRISQLLDLIWQEAERDGDRPLLHVRSHNDFPTAAGLASSASAFAALAVAGNHSLSTDCSAAQLSCIARRVSASAGRSLFAGFVELPAGQPGDASLPAKPLAPPEHWPLHLVVALTAEGKKAVGSTEGMIRTCENSPLYRAWVDAAPGLFRQIRQAVLERDLAALGPALEQSALTMHASALAADPGLLYWNGVTLNVLHAVRKLRAEGLPAYFTIDAGPHVKVISRAEHADALQAALSKVDGVRGTIRAQPGGAARIVEAGGEV